MPRRLALLAVVLAMVSASVVVATTASAAGTGSISGVVTGPGGVPVEGVDVQLFESGSSPASVIAPSCRRLDGE